MCKMLSIASSFLVLRYLKFRSLAAVATEASQTKSETCSHANLLMDEPWARAYASSLASAGTIRVEKQLTVISTRP